MLITHRPPPQLVEKRALLRRVMHRVVVVGRRAHRFGPRHEAVLVGECHASLSGAPEDLLPRRALWDRHAGSRRRTRLDRAALTPSDRTVRSVTAAAEPAPERRQMR